ncbi:hypothetical protein B0J18DRAFT_26166 [Chaetomium sp. MPI-SDFR-AT-0129]|nr:hypothetical protein B0J18DRAFT_26166 [Chaetomium sp. MPI-SDFR-AT-0129]
MTTKTFTPVSPTSWIAPRQVSSIFLIILLYTAATPFAPVSWLTGPVEMSGAYVLDRLVAGIILACACYFQWAIASLRAAVIVSLPSLSVGGGSTTRVVNGRVETVRTTGGVDSIPLWMWQTGDYWQFALVEAGLLAVAEFWGGEVLRRVIVGGVVGMLWLVGWSATPRSLKTWAWEHIKAYMFWIILDEIFNVGYGVFRGAAGGGARRRRGRF